MDGATCFPLGVNIGICLIIIFCFFATPKAALDQDHSTTNPLSPSLIFSKGIPFTVPIMGMSAIRGMIPITWVS